VRVDQDFTSDRDLLERVFSRLTPGDGTALYDATVEAIRRVAAEPAESKAVVLVTDGMDTASRASFADLRELARRSEVPVFSIALGGDSGFRSPFGNLGGIGGIGGPRGPGRGGWPRGPGRGWPGGGGGGGGRGWPGGTRAPMGMPTDMDARALLDLADETGGRAEILKGLERDALRSGRIKTAAESIAVTLRHRYLVGYEPESEKRGWRKIKVDVERPSVKVQSRKGYYAEG
jgi:VWFA-related protein